MFKNKYCIANWLLCKGDTLMYFPGKAMNIMSKITTIPNEASKYNVDASDAERLIADLRAHNTEEL